MTGPSEGPVSWELADRVATRMAGRQPWFPLGRMTVLKEDFAELTAEAEVLVERETGLRSLSGPARARVTDRPGWVAANIVSFQRLLRPLTEKLEATLTKPAPTLGRVPLRVPLQMSRNVSGAQVGLLLGWMSTRVLGQYDQLLIEDERPEDQDIVYYVGAERHRTGGPPRLPAKAVPSLAGVARGNSPGPVHGSAVGAPALPQPRGVSARGGRTRPEAFRRGSQAGRVPRPARATTRSTKGA